MAAAEVLYQSVAGDDHCGGAVGLQAAHGRPCFEPAVIALDAVVGVLVGAVEHAVDQLLDDRRQGLAQGR